MKKSQIKDRVGQKFGRLVVVKLDSIKDRNAMWDCLCECGKNTVVAGYHLKRTNSCGCLRDEKLVQRRQTHGATKNGKWSALYKTWNGIKDRCLNPSNKSWKYYGGRGIKMHEAWVSDFSEFQRYILQTIGERCGKMTIDRIKTESGYEPGNLRWATMAEQNMNKRAKNGFSIKKNICF